ncbi:DUF947-domain-containing protein [Lepidopterella palustris CBS 459.81]|uniref:rRNA biogenesis protein RRP36 n=1 Tax=Lepidopterella palustris CBS 459.81 TaxID=1314670 RepID=A0A8E2E8G7_9PEZI|nr:DUF947-domain-containing protein [Lepidopterella palustris CBS 459.81]
MPLSRTLGRSLRAREEDSDDEPYSNEPEDIAGEGGETASSSSETAAHGEDEADDGDSSDNADGEQFYNRLSKVSFGALAKAQDILSKGSSRKRKRGPDTTDQQEDKLQALREHLRDLRARRDAKPIQKVDMPKATEKDEGEENDSDGDSSSSDQPTHARSSKHAPTSLSSKRTVTRKRTVVEVKRPVVRDPRFHSLAGPRPDDAALKKKYGFLNEYKAEEMAELRATLKKTKNEADKEALKRKLLSIESQQKAQDVKDKRQDVIREHRKKEKELVKQGKKPFFLKRSEQKKIALINRFQSMKSKQRDHVIERRRKRATAKERKHMPFERRSS